LKTGSVFKKEYELILLAVVNNENMYFCNIAFGKMKQKLFFSYFKELI